MSTTQGRMSGMASWPPLVYFIFGGVGVILWLGGTSIQVLTSEAWMMHIPVGHIVPLAAYIQIKDFVTGDLADGLLIPFCFAWGVQMASVTASIGAELPREPAWRFYISWAVLIVLIGVNSCGDYQAALPYGSWGQLGFTTVILFLTFFVGFMSVLSIMKGIRLMKSGNSVI